LAEERARAQIRLLISADSGTKAPAILVIYGQGRGGFETVSLVSLEVHEELQASLLRNYDHHDFSVGPV
jgi:hypothetical protein